jgi:glutathione synthase/RimK-type ligase-like ATP-grasp enzyme
MTTPAHCKERVLIVAPPGDLHARAVSGLLQSQFETSAVIWDSSKLPYEDSGTLHLDANCASFEIRTRDHQIAFSTLRSIWWRRPESFVLDPGVTDAKVREFCLRECSSFFRGALDSAGVQVVNNPNAQSSAGRKPVQLMMAGRMGLTIPQTLMTNDAEELLSFWRRLDGKCVYKAFTSPSERLAETRIMTEEDLKYLDKLRHGPIIVQEKIEKGTDIRVNVFGERVFAASVTTHIAQAELDWRLDLKATWKEHSLPDDVAQKLVALLRALGLHYGCIDLRQRPDGVYVFFEVNPAGQFLFIEVETGQPLTQSMAELLVRPSMGITAHDPA